MWSWVAGPPTSFFAHFRVIRLSIDDVIKVRFNLSRTTVPPFGCWMDVVKVKWNYFLTEATATLLLLLLPLIVQCH